MERGKEEWVYKTLPTNALKAERELQREFDANHAQSIISDFEEGLVNPILVSARRDHRGGYIYVPINGQHTLAILKVKGIDNVMCRVGYNLTREREKILFAKVDTYFKSRSRAQQVVFDIRAGEGNGYEINKILKDYGFDYKLINCLASISSLYKANGEELLRKALKAYKDLFDSETDLHSNIFGGILDFLKENNGKIDIKKFRKHLSAFAGRMATPKELSALIRARSGRTSYLSVKEFLQEIANRKR
jgi:hypothetical protein